MDARPRNAAPPPRPLARLLLRLAGLWPFQDTLPAARNGAGLYAWRLFALPPEWSARVGNVKLVNYQSGDGPTPHCHPCWMLCVTLCGSAVETLFRRGPDGRPQVAERKPLARIRLYRADAEFLHTINDPQGLWTLAVRGPRRRAWGFVLADGTWVHHLDHKREAAA